MSSRIDRFDGEYAFLSNFHPSPIEWAGHTWPTVEHAYQATKTLNVDQQQMIFTAESPGRAKSLGRRVTLRPDWDKIRVPVMEGLIARKFAVGTPLAAKLLATGDAELTEGNHWHDNFWGVDFRTPEKGQNWLGKILMIRRGQLKALAASR